MVLTAFIASTLLLQPDSAALVPLYREALLRKEKQFGAGHVKVARSASDLGLYLAKLGRRDEALTYLNRALEIDSRTLSGDDPLVAEDLENVASLIAPVEAVALLSKAANCRDPATAARILGKLGSLHEQLTDREASLASYKQALAKEESASGPAHPRVAVRLNDIALRIEPRAAEPLLRRALAIQTDALGARHPETAITGNNLANVLLAVRRLPEAEQVQRSALKTLESSLGPEHPRVAIACSNLADILRTRRDFSGAVALYKRALAIDLKVYGPDHEEVAADRRNLADALKEAKRR